LCQIYNHACQLLQMQDRQPKSWTNQYRVADEQGFENERQTEADGMDVDTD
jgi:hypothetical protein